MCVKCLVDQCFAFEMRLETSLMASVVARTLLAVRPPERVALEDRVLVVPIEPAATADQAFHHG